MRNPDSDRGHTRQPVTTRTDRAWGSFQRVGPAEATLELNYGIGDLEVSAPHDSLSERVNILCEAEILRMRARLEEVGEALAAQLGDAGTDTLIRRTYHDRDSRSWEDRGGSFWVQGTVYRSKERLKIAEGASDARVVRAVVQLTVRQREEGIRKIYAKMLRDALANRGGPAGNRPS